MNLEVYGVFFILIRVFGSVFFLWVVFMVFNLFNCEIVCDRLDFEVLVFFVGGRFFSVVGWAVFFIFFEGVVGSFLFFGNVFSGELMFAFFFLGCEWFEL